MNEKEGSFRSSRTTVNSLTALDYKRGGLTVIAAAVFIIGEMAGSGILTLPSAIARESWIGIGVLIFCAIISAHASVYLADCWLMVEEKWPEYKTEKTRNPFSVIGIKAVGPSMKYVCSFFMDIQLFGVCVVFLIFMSKLFQGIYNQFIPAEYHIAFCLWIVIFGVILIPLSWLGSPHNLTAIAYGAMSCTIISCFLVLFILLGEAPRKMPNADYSLDTSVKGLGEFALAFGTILFVFGGTCTFPTFQNSMRDKKQFPKAVYLGFTGMLLLYLPIAILGYATYGIKCKETDDILDNADVGPVKTTVNFLMAFHLFCAYLICLNPLNLDLEEYLQIKNSFNLRRIIFRTVMTLLIIFVALSVPSFGKILNFIGAFSVSAVAYILTPWFYIKLCKLEVGNSLKREIPTYRLSYLILIIVIGTLGGCISTYSSVADMVKKDTFVAPCYAGGWN